MGTDAVKPETSPPAEIPIFRTEENRARLMSIYQEKLSRWPVQFEAFFVTTRYGKTHVIASGDPSSPVVVLLHPQAASALVWSSLAPALSGQFRLYALDTIGEAGPSELDDLSRYPKNGRDYSAWLDDVHAQLGAATADVIAGSAGGWIAMNRAVEAPDRVRRLVLLGPMGIASWRSTLRVLGPLLSLALRPTDAKRDKMMTRGLGAGDRANREMGPWFKIAGKCAGKAGWPVKISARRLQMIQAPTLLFLGGKDDVVGNARAAARRARRTIAGCQIEILPDAGHLMMFDEPEAIGARITGFLQEDRN